MTPPLVIPPYLKEAPLTGLIGMGGGATSLRVYTASSSDSYQITKSLRFSEDDDAYLSRANPANGNRKTWTLNFWYKRTLTGGQGSSDYIFGCGPDANNTVYVYMDSTTLRVYSAEGGSNDTSMTTTQYFRDPGSWQMHTLAIDTTHPTETERLRYWVNGEQITSWSNANYPSQGADLQVNKNVNHYFGRTNDGSTDPLLDAYLSDVYLIDGLALNPASFGSKDSTGNWNPKTFSPPVVNDGTTWSSSLYTSNSTYDNTTTDTNFATGDEADEGFLNTDATDGTVEAGTSYSGADLPAWIYFRPATSIKNVSTIRVRTRYAGTIRVNDVDTYTGTASVYPTWVPIPTEYVPTTLTSIAVQSTTGNARISGIEINGVVLVDGKTDIEETVGTGAAAIVNVPCTTFPFVDSVTQGYMSSSDNLSVEGAGTNSFGLGNVAVFDAASDKINCSQTSNAYGNPWTIDTYMKLDSLPSAVSYWTGFDADNGNAIYCIGMTSDNKFAFWQTAGGNNVYDDTVRAVDTWYHIRVTRDASDKIRMWINGTEASQGSEDAQTVGSSAGDFRVGNWYGSSNTSLSSFRGNVGPTRLVAADLGAPPSGGLVTTSGVLPSYVAGVYANTFHLKFDDTSSTAALGYDSISARTIRKQGSTTDFSTDADASSLVLAIPGDTIEDVHATVKGSGSAKSLTNTNCTTSTTTSHFYGTSTHLNGTNAKLTTTTDSTDFDISGGTFTFECWFMSGESTSTSKTIVSTKETGGGTGALELGINQNKLFCYSGSNQIMTTTESTATVSALTTYEWYHLAVTRDGTTWRWFVDGVLAHSNATSVSGSSDGCFFGYASTAGGSPSTRWLNGNFQDIRFYKGVAKYTSAFTPPAPNNFAVRGIAATGTSTAITYSDSSADNGVRSSGSWAQLFNGDAQSSGVAINQSSDTYGVAFDNLDLQCHSSIGVWTYTGASTPTVRVTSTSNIVSTFDGVSNNTWTDWSYTHGNIKKIELGYLGGSGSANTFLALRIDGKELVDGTPLVSPYELDSLTDTPTNYGEDSGTGGEVRGNYATLNPLQKYSSDLRQGNLFGGNTANTDGTAYATIRCPTSGVWYCEATFEEWTAGGNNFGIGVDTAQNRGSGTDLRAFSNTDSKSRLAGFNDTYMFKCDGSGGGTNIGTLTLAKGDVWQCCYDVDNGKLYYGKNNTWYTDAGPGSGAAFNASNHFYSETFLQDGGFFYLNGFDATGHINFGQQPWKYTPPLSAKALCTQNLSDTFSGDDVNNPSKYFDVKTYTGNGADQNIKGVDFQPDFVWVKERNGTQSHHLQDVIRGVTYNLVSNLNNAQSQAVNTVKAFNSDGFTTGSDIATNNDDDTYVSWMWDAGTAASGANTNGTVNVSSGNQWANATAGFSITKYTGDNASGGSTVGHGLSAKPEFVFVKRLDAAQNWVAMHKDLTATKSLYLHESTSEETPAGGYVDYTNTTASVVKLVGDPGGNGNTNYSTDYIMYAWTSIEGYSAAGSYSGNASTDGPFAYLGFRPRFIIFKNIDTGNGWRMMDTAVNTYNPLNTGVYPNSNSAEDSPINWTVDYLSNGFKIRDNNNELNGSGNTIIYMAWAENPFKTSRAR